tara:strand:- start:571 stop:1314 length:744 start_codon:yes stop_codon:yes gene_type:complete
MNNSEYIKIALIVGAAIAMYFLINRYNSTQNTGYESFEGAEDEQESFTNYQVRSPPSNESLPNSNNEYQGGYEGGADGHYTTKRSQAALNNNNPNVAQVPADNQTLMQPEGQLSCNEPRASEPMGGNEVFRSLSNFEPGSGPVGLGGNQLPKDCYPKDQLTPSELLPQDANSKWAQVNPSGQGDLQDQNFLNAGHHVGINTVGQTLRNANMQLRSEPPNPQVKVSPWGQSTIEPDTNRRAMEIGGCE